MTQEAQHRTRGPTKQKKQTEQSNNKPANNQTKETNRTSNKTAHRHHSDPRIMVVLVSKHVRLIRPWISITIHKQTKKQTKNKKKQGDKQTKSQSVK